jgi:hypothetical protein
VDYDTNKNSSKAKLSGYSKHTKKKYSKLSARRKRQKSAEEVSKRDSRDAPSYFRSQMEKSVRESSMQNVYQQQLKSAVQAINEGEHFSVHQKTQKKELPYLKTCYYMVLSRKS